MSPPLTSNHRAMLKRRGKDPKNYTFLKNTYASVYFRDKRSGKVYIILKGGGT